ncbi:hypothetical protein BC834DRAFT_877055 [Gloeopeniophorella convolvens]|nr:hypothetical protein BC834DRAFT_877055 [Gloeopeniophorella convolvens]
MVLVMAVTRSSKAANGAAGSASSSHSMTLRSSPQRQAQIKIKTKTKTKTKTVRKKAGLTSAERIKSRLGASKRTQPAVVRAVIRAKTSHRSNIQKQRVAVSLSQAELMGELPEKIRKEVEVIRKCCRGIVKVMRTGGITKITTASASSLAKHQLFSLEHAASLRPDIRQWLPRIVCPAYPINFDCRGGGQRGDAMVRHTKGCESFKHHFLEEHLQLFPDDNQPCLSGDYKFLKMTAGQLAHLDARLRPAVRAAGLRSEFTQADAEEIDHLLRTWMPLPTRGMPRVPAEAFPRHYLPQFFCAGAPRTSVESSAYDADSESRSPMMQAQPAGVLSPPQTQQDRTPVLPQVPEQHAIEPPQTPSPRIPEFELYPPPHGLSPESDSEYYARALAAWAPQQTLDYHEGWEQAMFPTDVIQGALPQPGPSSYEYIAGGFSGVDSHDMELLYGQARVNYETLDFGSAFLEAGPSLGDLEGLLRPPSVEEQLIPAIDASAPDATPPAMQFTTVNGFVFPTPMQTPVSVL